MYIYIILGWWRSAPTMEIFLSIPRHYTLLCDFSLSWQCSLVVHELSLKFEHPCFKVWFWLLHMGGKFVFFLNFEGISFKLGSFFCFLLFLLYLSLALTIAWVVILFLLFESISFKLCCLALFVILASCFMYTWALSWIPHK